MKTDDGALYFESDLDNKKINSAVTETTRRITGMSDATVAAGDKIDKVFANLTSESTNSSTAIQKHATQEKGRIEELRETITKLTQARDKAYSIEKIEAYNQRIKQETEDLKELTHAGLENKEATDQQAASGDVLSSSIGKWALGLGGATAILAVLKKALLETTGGLNAFNIVSAITKQLLNDIVTGAGFSAERLQSAAEIQRGFNALRTEGYAEEYKAAGLNNQYQKLYAESLDATLSREDKIKKIDEALKAHDESIELRSEHVRKAIELTGQALLNQPDNEKYKKEYAALNTELTNLDSERYESTKRLIRQKSILIKEGIDEELAWRKKLHDDLQRLADEQIQIDKDNANKLRDLNNEIAVLKTDGEKKELLQLKQKYDIDMLEYADNEKMKAALTEKYALQRYEIESKYLKKLQDENIKFAETISKIDPGKGYSILDRTLVNAGIKPPTGNELTQEGTQKTGLAAGSAKWAKEMNKDIEDYNKGLIKQEELHKRIFDQAVRFTFELGRQLGLSEEQQQTLGSTLDMFTSLAEGGPAGYIGAAVSLFSALMSAIPSQAAEFQAQIDQINKAIEKQQNLIALSQRSGGEQDVVKKELDMLNQEKASIEAQIAKDQKKMASWIDLFGSKERAQSDLVKQTEALDKLKDQITEVQQSYDDLLSGGVTQNNIADVIAQGFQDGKTSVDDFASYMNNTLLNAVTEVFKKQILGDSINAISKQIQTALSDKILTSQEVSDIDAKVKQVADLSKPLWDSLTQGLGLGTLGQPSSLTSTIQRSITEDTATEWVGLVRKQADDIRVTRDYTKLGVDRLIGIETNTAQTVVQLQLALKELQGINKNTAPVYSGLGG